MPDIGKVVIVDTGTANLLSLYNALKRLGADPVVSRDEKTLKSASRLFLPGVGTAGAVMQMIRERGLGPLLEGAAQPILGICLGMQALCASSEESGGVKMLGLIPAEVKKLSARGLPLPHMGWNQTVYSEGEPLFKGIPQGAYFYYVHSFGAPVGASTVAQSLYGEPFSAALRKDNFSGVQFHPEKSGRMGAKLLENFLELK